MRVVLLGGAGYIGSVASHHLVSLGHHVTVVDGLIYNRGDHPGRLLPGAATFVNGDLRDLDLLARVSDSADAVVHLGGIVGEPACQLDEELAVELNYAAPMLAAETVAAVVPGSKIQRGPERDEADARDYRVSFTRLQQRIPGACSATLKDGVQEIADLLVTRQIIDPAEPQYDNHRGLAEAFTAGMVASLRTPGCRRYLADYTAAWGQQ
ncbi:NAD-dependent epimerase/dehydratase family protein [Kitasatospora sp. NPDC086801]|uniref:NAD-dependent epimerase/dehydratase family protein n=1 Tax=Kitasatospora sp. NPDC086801 TaxID=3364066 RepID=UPI003810F6AE